MEVCCVCSKPEDPNDTTFQSELRPYGPGGKPICYACAMSTETLIETAKQAVHQKLTGFFDAGVTVAITEKGIMPLNDALKMVKSGEICKDDPCESV